MFCHTATVQFGREAYTGVGLTEEAARSMADFYAIQQTSYDFDEVPPGVAIGYQVIFTRKCLFHGATLEIDVPTRILNMKNSTKLMYDLCQSNVEQFVNSKI